MAGATLKLIAFVPPLGLDTFGVASATPSECGRQHAARSSSPSVPTCSFQLTTTKPSGCSRRRAPGPYALALGASISLAELAIGFSEADAIAIAAQALIVTQVGVRLGRRVGERSRESAERIAARALITLGAVLVASTPSGKRAGRGGDFFRKSRTLQGSACSF